LHTHHITPCGNAFCTYLSFRGWTGKIRRPNIAVHYAHVFAAGAAACLIHVIVHIIKGTSSMQQDKDVHVLFWASSNTSCHKY